ncbi:endonuclease domain-containing protein [Aminobacter sp. J44]|uniref:endonuclease domain-containing protein n=1 Tax=Aminobacter sp. J44 TaxID=935262 RepID=UPI0011A1CB93|nr:endonuclease domain-containing protein [Aminobacter sp. J44]
MPTAASKAAIARARRLRREMTDGERRLWDELRQFRRWYGIHVRRQVPVGPYVTDFAIHSHRLVIEVDGEHHFEPLRQARDAERVHWLNAEGYRVLRFNTGELEMSLDGCVEEILRALGVAPNSFEEATVQ